MGDTPRHSIDVLFYHHVTGFSNLVDLWVIKTKKSLWSFAHVVLRDHVDGARNAYQAARTCEKFLFYRQNKILWWSSMADVFVVQDCSSRSVQGHSK